MAERGVLYVYWGDRAAAVAERSMASLRRHHPELPIHVERLPDGLDPELGLSAKARMFAMSPFESTLFLDADTVVLDRLDFAFEKAERFGLACSICECPWARRFAGLSGDVVEYNTGVVFFSSAAGAIFQAWEAASATVDSSTLWIDAHGAGRGMRFNDQAAFAAAVEGSGMAPFVLPANWNFRPEWHRSVFLPIKIWHDYRDVPERLAAMSEACAQGGQPVRYVEFARPPGARG